MTMIFPAPLKPNWLLWMIWKMILEMYHSLLERYYELNKLLLIINAKWINKKNYMLNLTVGSVVPTCNKKNIDYILRNRKMQRYYT